MRISSLLRFGVFQGVAGALAFLSCQSERRQEVKLTQSSEKTTASWQEVFTQNKEFVYQVSRFEGSQHRVTDTVVLTSTGRIWDRDATQKNIGWSNRTAGTKGGTGVAESQNGIWLRPPRFGEYAILELSPFPEIKLPFKVGQEWDWKLEVGSHYSNPAWAVWQDQMLVKTRYKSIGKQLVATPLGKLECQQVDAVAQCSAGQAKLSLLFHPQYGFVELDYININGSRMKFQLLSVGIANTFDAASYFGK